MANKGWIKLYRDLQDHWLWSKEPFDKRSAWIDILLSVNREEKEFYSKGELLKLKPGQMITSIPKLAKKWNWSENRVRRYFRLLDGSGMCTIVGRGNGSLITVINWDFYQGGGSDSGRGNGSADGRSGGRADGTLTRNKEYKEGENIAPIAPLSEEEEEERRWNETIRAYKEAHGID